MADETSTGMSRREFVQGTASGVLLAVGSGAALAATSTNKLKDKEAVLAQIPRMHAANVKRLQDWIALPSTGSPLSLPAVGFGLGHGFGAHAPDEFYPIDSTNPKVQGLDGAVASFVECLYALA